MKRISKKDYEVCCELLKMMQKASKDLKEPFYLIKEITGFCTIVLHIKNSNAQDAPKHACRYYILIKRLKKLKEHAIEYENTLKHKTDFWFEENDFKIKEMFLKSLINRYLNYKSNKKIPPTDNKQASV